MSASQSNIGTPGWGTYDTNSPEVLLSEPVAQNSAGTLRAQVIARRVSNGAAKTFTIEAGYKRDTGDVTVFGVSLLNANGTTGDLIALASVAATIDADGGNIRVLGSGLNGVDIDWSAVLTGVTVNHEA